MREEVVISLLALGAYLLGAVPFGFLIGRVRGVDIRRVGSGNIGATNVFRTIGTPWGALSLLCDALKGLVPTLLFPLVVAGLCDVDPGRGLALLYGCLAVVGHNWPVYLKFKGGKGIATTAGALIGIAPAALGLGLAAWVTMFAASRYVSLASIVAAIVIPAAAWWLYADAGMLVPTALTVLGCVAVLRHRPNIARLAKGTENRIRLGAKR